MKTQNTLSTFSSIYNHDFITWGIGGGDVIDDFHFQRAGDF